MGIGVSIWHVIGAFARQVSGFRGGGNGTELTLKFYRQAKVRLMEKNFADRVEVSANFKAVMSSA